MASARPAITSQRQVTFSPVARMRASTCGHSARRGRTVGGDDGLQVRRGHTHRDPGPGYLGYVVPDVTIDSLDAARALGIRGEDDLFGGVVPFPFVATKTITHPLIDPAAAAPEGWQSASPSAFAMSPRRAGRLSPISDARAAGRRLLQGGDVRIKLASGIGGAGQSVARSEAELDAELAAIGPADFADGVVLERNLVGVRTYSVGRVRVGSLLASYIGTQRTTRSRHGKEVYGGSTIEVARGGFEALYRLALEDGARRAIRSALAYHQPRWRATPACSRLDATTTSPRDAMQAAGNASAFSSSRGESAAPVARKWQRSRR